MPAVRGAGERCAWRIVGAQPRVDLVSQVSKEPWAGLSGLLPSSMTSSVGSESSHLDLTKSPGCY